MAGSGSLPSYCLWALPHHQGSAPALPSDILPSVISLFLCGVLDLRSVPQRNDWRRRRALQVLPDAEHASTPRIARAWPLRRRVLPTTRTVLHSGFQEHGWVESRRTLHRIHGLSPRESWHMQGQDRLALEDGSTIARWLVDEKIAHGHTSR